MWRIALALAMPSLSRDGVGFCWFARDLGERGVAVIRDGDYDQHPLFPLLILAVQRVLASVGAPDAPLTWQRSGQLVALLGGMAVVVLCGVVAVRLARALGARADGDRIGLWALLLAGVLPLGVGLSADVMSDTVHLAFYLAGVALLIRLQSARAALAVGLFGGLAFLTRPEGAVVALAGGAALAVQWLRGGAPLRASAARTAALLAGFLICAAPYWAALGKLSPKLEKEVVTEFVVRGGPEERPRADGQPALVSDQARLLRQRYAWYEALGQAAYQTLRGGRVVIPLLGLVALAPLLRRGLSAPLCGINACLATHFVLTAALALRHGYLDPRHTLVVVALLGVFAALVLVEWLNGIARRRWAALLRLGLALGCLSPLAIYALRVPNAHDGPLRSAGERLGALPGHVASRVLVGGSNEKRIAFYADCVFQPWAENEPTPERRLEALRHQVLDAAGASRPAYFAIVTRADPGDENAELLAQFESLPDIRRSMRAAIEIDFPDGRGTLRVFQFHRSAGANPPPPG